MTLAEYTKKRDFRRSPEPQPRRRSSPPSRAFVVQKHDATRLHYDFRLEWEGVLKSWAVPKGPSLDPSVKSLAVRVEDHPLEYAKFEGTIPEHEYGGGTVMVWDHGQWEPEDDPDEGLKTGKLSFQLHGDKLRGSWTLVQMKGRAGGDGKNWLLIKHTDDYARDHDDFDVLTEHPESVVSGRDLESIAADANAVWSSKSNGKASGRKRSPGKAKPKSARSAQRSTRSRGEEDGANQQAVSPASLAGARKSRQPESWKPQLATLVDRVPDGDEWLHEIKFDGYRLVAILHDGRVRLLTRSGNDWTSKLPKLRSAIEALGWEQAILDGELVALDKNGRTDFQKLQNSFKSGRTGSLVYYIFDLPHYGGYDLTGVRLEERKRLLAELLRLAGAADGGLIRYSDHIRGGGQTVLEHACKLNAEGIISKRDDSHYFQRRSRSWVKSKCEKRQEFVIGGFTDPSGSRTGFGALLLGYYDNGRLIYCGRVGTGFNTRTLTRLSKDLSQRETDECPFHNPPTGSKARGVHWVRPELVAEVQFGEWTSDGVLRHPSFEGLRPDKPARQVVRETPAAVEAVTEPSSARSRTKGKKETVHTSTKKRSGESSGGSGATLGGVKLSNPDRVLFPETRLTKRQLAEFYERISPWILPHLVDRPLTLVRCPRGRQSQCFYQKHFSEAMSATLRGVDVAEKGQARTCLVVKDLPGLISLVQLGVLELHPWGARADDLEKPDRLIFDLDPGEGVSWQEVVQAARDVRDRLEGWGLTTFVRLSGGKGLHVVVPLVRRSTWDELKQFAKDVAGGLAHRHPDRYLATMTKSKRKGKVYLDYLRNRRGATAVASYSTRARAGAPVATPLRWDELSASVTADHYTVDNLPRRLEQLKQDPWDGFFDIRQSLGKSVRDAAANSARRAMRS